MGFIIDPSGLAITNNHVVTGAALLRVWIGGNKDKEYDARWYPAGASECSDLALIKIDGDDFPYLTWHDGDPKVGMDVYAGGYPLGEPDFAMTKGIISEIAAADGKTSWASVKNVLMHDATINPGNSGGPLIDARARWSGSITPAIRLTSTLPSHGRKLDLVLKDLKAGKNVTSIGVNGQVVSGTLPNGKDIAGVSGIFCRVRLTG